MASPTPFNATLAYSSYKLRPPFFFRETESLSQPPTLHLATHPRHTFSLFLCQSCHGPICLIFWYLGDCQMKKYCLGQTWVSLSANWFIYQSFLLPGNCSVDFHLTSMVAFPGWGIGGGPCTSPGVQKRLNYSEGSVPNFSILDPSPPPALLELRAVC